jgi:PAS domain S-box-containing protein
VTDLLRDLSIGKKLIAIAMLSSMAAILLAGVSIVTLTWQSRQARYAEELTSLSRVIGGSCEAALTFGIRKGADDVLPALAAIPSIKTACVYNTEGLIFATYQRAGENQEVGSEPMPLEEGIRFSGRSLIVTQKISRSGEHLGTIVIQDDMQKLYDELKVEVTGLVVVMLVALAMAALVASWLQKLIASPILALAQTAKLVSEEKSYDLRAEPAGKDEIGTLITTFNEMLSQIQTRDTALQESENRLRMVIDLLPEIIFVKDREGRFLLINKAGAEIYDATVEQVTGRLHADLHENRREVEKMLADDLEVIELGQRKSIPEMALELAPGRLLWLQTTKVPIPLPDTEDVGVLGISIDIGERKRAEEELRNLRNYLSNIIDSMPSILVGVDVEGRVTQWNREAQRITGINADSAIGQPLERAFGRLASEMERIRVAISRREPQHKTKLSRVADGETRYEDLTVYPLVANGVEGAVIRIDDVTDRVRIEEMMIQTEKMMSVGGLAAGMAHEINNPLAIILQSAQNTLRRTSDELSANQKVAEECGTTLAAVRAYLERRSILDFVGDIREAGARASQIVKNMLSFSRKGGGLVQLENIPELLDRTIELASSDYDLKKKHDFKQIEIIREYDADVPWVPCEASKIQQVFLNILKNGAEAMSEHPDSNHPHRFTLRVSKGKEEEMVVVEIEDNGPGIDEATRRRVFEPFYTTKEVGSGTGLGLSVSYFIVTENHGGALTVESDGSTGTKFIISLPIHQQGDGWR